MENVIAMIELHHFMDASLIMYFVMSYLPIRLLW